MTRARAGKARQNAGTVDLGDVRAPGVRYESDTERVDERTWDLMNLGMRLGDIEQC